MPTGPLYNWLCVLHSAADIVARAAQIRASQTGFHFDRRSPSSRRRADSEDNFWEGSPAPSPGLQRSSDDTNVTEIMVSAEHPTDRKNLDMQNKSTNIAVHESLSWMENSPEDKHVSKHRLPVLEVSNVPRSSSQAEGDVASLVQPSVYGQIRPESVPSKSTEVVTDTLPEAAISTSPDSTPVPVARHLQSSKVPSSRLGRLFHYGGLAASLGYGAASELVRRSASSSGDTERSSVMMTEANIKRLVSKLSEMRGAALKLGQFMSIQDTHILPAEVDKIFRRVQDSAHYMPDWQMEQVLVSSLGSSWSNYFLSFARVPFAAASIGQVHSAVLAASSSPTGRDEPVAVKVQFPNVANSIASDLGYMKMLLTAGRLLPKGLFLDKTIQVMKGELTDECDYAREASFIRRFSSPAYLGDDPRFKVPWVWDGSTDRVLVMEYVKGINVGDSAVKDLPQKSRNEIAARIIELCLKELFQFRLMQTDPNWTNFLWNFETEQIALIDFGATREYSKEFVDSWLKLLQSGAAEDRDACIQWSRKLGYLTGEENEIMLDAHINSMILLATPFKASTPQPYSFGKGGDWANITAEIRAQIPVMLTHRLTPPPRETYSLNRKLSGAFLLASRLNAEVDTKSLWDKITGNYQFS